MEAIFTALTIAGVVILLYLIFGYKGKKEMHEVKWGVPQLIDEEDTVYAINLYLLDENDSYIRVRVSEEEIHSYVKCGNGKLRLIASSDNKLVVVTISEDKIKVFYAQGVKSCTTYDVDGDKVISELIANMILGDSL